MGKDQELLQAVKTEDLMTVQKLLQRPKPGKAMWQQHTPAQLNTAPCNDGVNEHEVHPHHCTFTIGESGTSCHSELKQISQVVGNRLQRVSMKTSNICVTIQDKWK
ncbi:Caskin-1 [Anabarilius grahami]|uniref:Caskin-1 n=1 Tax=Anabarilius grahami TaxID=495550 RepID=A0A3N0YT42_ANAGA|nr:Caskin-1 [Anabarilius grahami]